MKHTQRQPSQGSNEDDEALRVNRSFPRITQAEQDGHDDELKIQEVKQSRGLLDVGSVLRVWKLLISRLGLCPQHYHKLQTHRVGKSQSTMKAS